MDFKNKKTIIEIASAIVFVLIFILGYKFLQPVKKVEINVSQNTPSVTAPAVNSQQNTTTQQFVVSDNPVVDYQGKKVDLSSPEKLPTSAAIIGMPNLYARKRTPLWKIRL